MEFDSGHQKPIAIEVTTETKGVLQTITHAVGMYAEND
jgi:hypothetical protein